MNRFRLCVVLFGSLAMLGLSVPVRAEREVVVNGQRLSAEQIADLERMHCGPVPDGNYWLSERFGMWGHAGNPAPQGRIADNCRNPGASSLRERRIKLLREARNPAKTTDPKHGREIHREESEIGTTSQPHAPTDPNMPQANGR